VDIRLDISLQEAFRHAKPLAACCDGTQPLENARIDLHAPGVMISASPAG
jgi:hypothetical protein